MIPSRNQCYALLSRTRMPGHIVAHSIQVFRVARCLALALADCGLALDMDLLTASALLHDITKPRSFTTGERHSETGAVFLADRGYARVGQIVRQHVSLDAYEPDTPVTEAGLVNYADKRVLHDRIVSLERRMAYILERYGKTPERKERLRWLWQVSEDLEKKIYMDLPFTPEDLTGQVCDSGLAAEMAVFRLKVEG